jgi:hypothetical protein
MLQAKTYLEESSGGKIIYLLEISIQQRLRIAFEQHEGTRL